MAVRVALGLEGDFARWNIRSHSTSRVSIWRTPCRPPFAMRPWRESKLAHQCHPMPVTAADRLPRRLAVVGQYSPLLTVCATVTQLSPAATFFYLPSPRSVSGPRPGLPCTRVTS
ncbi:hypothetical protein ACJQWK_00951 [Exserohilum turcicum]